MEIGGDVCIYGSKYANLAAVEFSICGEISDGLGGGCVQLGGEGVVGSMAAGIVRYVKNVCRYLVKDVSGCYWAVESKVSRVFDSWNHQLDQPIPRI